MKEEEIEKMLKELYELRKTQKSKTLTSIRPTGSSSITNKSNRSLILTSWIVI